MKTKIALWSGGKDSTAMIDLLLRDKKQVDYIVFNDTLNEFSAMYEYIAKVSNYWKERYNAKIVITKPQGVFITNQIQKITTKGAFNGRPKGLLSSGHVFCRWRRESKVYPLERFIKENHIKDYTLLLGITIDEMHRAKFMDRKFEYPLIYDYKMNESDCKNYLKDRELENPLYRHFERTGCFFCPYASLRSFYRVWKYYPKEWAKMKEYESLCLENAINKSWFLKNRSCEYMEQKFSKEQELEFIDDEPLKDCMCKI
ncbi:phosphoadenosine phosphosulfate reductase family protein [Helicobacter cetorum]|uniref:Phage protein n=1 Tax=Helicobacter cetorum (strain ATCC BAA-429 / MIT 00-7128) TaxID=182217 RepID=I0ELL3_HELC0|nr:phosphoadenosine phosphosulfate reductase family protein [Helicobacter cetorum]AFI03832.1 phage protein [Helicobacter cetorum MIT 00-7128]